MVGSFGKEVMNKNRVNGSIVEKNEIWYARLYVTDENGKESRFGVQQNCLLKIIRERQKRFCKILLNSTARSVKPSTVKLLLQII